MKTSDIEPFFATLQRANPQPASELEYSNVFELLAAVLLSAQATDAGVNKATRRLFPRANTPQKMLALGLPALTEAIRSIGLYRNKAKNLYETCRLLVERHGGEVPRTMAELTALPGVGRKTANVVLGNAFGLDEGVVVDTHVARLARRLGLTRQSDPVKIESDLIGLVPRAAWTLWSHLLICHGRAVCRAPRPRCAACALADLCPSAAPG